MKESLRYEKEIRESSAFRTIESDIRRGEFSHAYFILSEDKDAVDTLFALIAMRAYCDSACGACKECRKILLRSKPDVKYLAEGSDNFSVKEMTEVTEDAGLTAFEGGRKLYFFKNFECVSEQSQNKLLKTLEEPFDGVHFILSAVSSATVLQTVLSRVKQVVLSAFSEESIKEGLIASGVEKEKAERGARLSSGSFTKARAFAADEDFARHASEAADLLVGLKGSADVHNYLKNPIFSKERILSSLSMIELVMSDVIRYHASLPIALREKEEEIGKIAEMYSLSAAGEALNVTLKCRERLKANCIAQNVADYLMLKLVEVKYKCR